MSEKTAISWCDHTWSPVWGCTQVSKAETGGGGCDNCYAMTLAHRFGYGWNGEPMREFGEHHWQQPLRWNERARKAGKRATVFPSMCDPFDNDWPEGLRARFFELIADTPNLTWLLLTKRIGNAARMIEETMRELTARDPERLWLWDAGYGPWGNVWIGATLVNRTEMLRDARKLKAVRAALHFWSYEPALGGLGEVSRDLLPDWVIAGGESGPRARPAHPDWFRSLRDQCAAAGVPFHFKQWGEWWEVDSEARDEDGAHHVVEVPGIEAEERFDPKTDCLVGRDGRVFRSLNQLPLDTPARHMTRLGKAAAGRLLDGVEHNGFPK